MKSHRTPGEELATGYDVTMTCVRLQMAAAALLDGRSPAAREMDRWMGKMLSAGSFTGEAATEFGVSLSADHRRLTWRVYGDPDHLIPPMGDYLLAAGIPDAEICRLGEAEETIAPERLCTWIERTGESLNVGWTFPVDVPLAQALPGAARAGLREWAKKHGIEACTSLGRAIGAGNPYSQLRLPLPGEKTAPQLAAALEAFAALGVPSPSDDVVGALLERGRAELALSAWLSASGVVKMGLLVPQPETKLALHLCRAAGVRPDQYKTLAGFEGVLGVDGPAYAECQQFADGFHVEFHYVPPVGKTGESMLR